jgi:predicted naringenin-chalcone synthase
MRHGLPQLRDARVGILGVGSALAPHASRQQDLLPALLPSLESGSARERLARRIFDNASIDERRFCIPDFRSDSDRVLYQGPRPGLGSRMDVYRREAPRLAASACERALKSARVGAEEITHLVVVTCTGIFTPGPDVELIARLSLRSDVERTIVGFMGCSGAFHGMRVARRAALERDARVLLVCVELCSVHRLDDSGGDALVAQSIFADGSASLVLGAVRDGRRAMALLGADRTHLEPGTREALTWEMRDEGFAVRISSLLPSLIEAHVTPFVTPLLEGADPQVPLAWVVHPGGAAILRAVQRGLGLGHEEVASAWSVLRRLGNTSSCAVLYVLEEALAQLADGAPGVMLGFGPGLTFEAVRFERGPGA